jgi:hypothetical protein
VEDLVDEAVDLTVRSGEVAAGRLLLAALERRGEDAVWEATLVLLAALASRPVYGLSERAGVEHLRAVARSTPAVNALLLEVQAEHRDAGRPAAREVWEQADAAVRWAGVVQLLVVVDLAVGSDHGRPRRQWIRRPAPPRGRRAYLRLAHAPPPPRPRLRSPPRPLRSHGPHRNDQPS